MNENKIELLASANWSRTNWDLSWQPIVELSELLPKVGESYEIVLLESEGENTSNGLYDLLWLPPHSELNGLDDRPTEVLKANVIKAELVEGEWFRNEYGYLIGKKFRAKIISVNRISETLSKLQLSHDKHIESYFNIHGSTVSYYEWDDYLYLTQSAEYVKDEFLFVKSRIGYSLIFINNWVSDRYQCEICKVELNERQNKFIQSLLKSSERITPISQISVSDNQVQGALYY